MECQIEQWNSQYTFYERDLFTNTRMRFVVYLFHKGLFVFSNNTNNKGSIKNNEDIDSGPKCMKIVDIWLTMGFLRETA